MAQQTKTELKSSQPAKVAPPVKTPLKQGDTGSVNLIFERGNYRLLIISIAVVALGFILMSGTTDIYGTTKTVIAPLVVLGGFALGFFAIFKKPENS
jgi:hypothetical protein